VIRGNGAGRWLRRSAAVGTGAALAACTVAPPPPPPAPIAYADPTVATAVLTRPLSDTHRVEMANGALVVSAPGSNQAGGMRIVVTPNDNGPATVDEETCGTWAGATGHQVRQEGAALRIATSGGVTRGITVTKAVWADEFWRFNVHTWNTAIPDTATSSPALWIATFDLGGTFGRGPGLRRFPWRMCARAIGDIVSFVVWPVGEQQPSWDDARYGGAVRLPAGEVRAGRAGWYAGHLQPGSSVAYADRSENPFVPAPPPSPDPGADPAFRSAEQPVADPRAPFGIPSLP
jgi:hypothetical protein